MPQTVTALEAIRDLIHAQSYDRLREELSRTHFSDVADMIIELPPEEEAIIFRVLPKDHASAVFSYLPLDAQEELIRSLASNVMLGIIDGMAPDDRTRLLEELPAEVTRRMLESLSPEELKSARLLLGYPENSAGRYMTPEYVTVGPEMTAAQALEHIRKTGRGKETLNIVYILDEAGPPLICVKATDDREEVLRTFEKYDRFALPVTDEAGKMLGIITIDDVLDVAEARNTEEMQKMGGSEALDAPYTQVSNWTLVRKRGGWLSALFLGEMLTATAMSYFEVEISKAVVLALFVPLIISSGGNSGSQASSLIIRALALRELRLRDWFRVFRRELFSGVLLGALLGAIGFVRIVMWERLHFTDYGPHYWLVAITVWISLIGVVTFGTLAGAMLPFILRRLGFDPATSSAPFVATLVDVTGLIIYFTVAMFILRGTIL